MPDRSRIPRSAAKFNVYIINSTEYLFKTGSTPPHEANWERLGLSEANAGEWKARRNSWHNLFKKYFTPDTRTVTIIREVQHFITSFRTFGNRLLNIIAISPNATEADAGVFNFTLHRKARSVPREAIDEACVPMIQPTGGGTMKIVCRARHDSDRASIPARADSVLFAFKVGDPAPRSPHDGTTMVVRRQARFHYDFGVENAGKRVSVFFCWNDTKRPALKGAWSAVRSVHLY